jgi:putative Ca2+/H+ antiporter (TMEM165/GDT1 family)
VDAFLLSLGIVFVAEMGDKTQLVALCLACRFNAKVVLAGVFCATLLVHMCSVLIGGGVGKILPIGWVKLAAGVAFIGFGLWTLRGDTLSGEECERMRGRSPFWMVFTTFFLAELGDKTMLSTVTLAADHSILPVWLGSSLGMVLADGLAIIVGQVLGAKLPERAIKIAAAAIFIAFGLFSGWQGAHLLLKI